MEKQLFEKLNLVNGKLVGDFFEINSPVKFAEERCAELGKKYSDWEYKYVINPSVTKKYSIIVEIYECWSTPIGERILIYKEPKTVTIQVASNLDCDSLISKHELCIEILGAIIHFDVSINMEISFIQNASNNGFSTEKYSHQLEIYRMCKKRLIQRYYSVLSKS